MAEIQKGLKYRVVLLLCITILYFITWGFFYSVGIYYMRWIEYFEAEKGEVAIVGAFPAGTASFLGPLFGIVVHRFGFRATGLVGGMMTSVGLIVSSMSTSLFHLGFFFGMVSGFGVGLVTVAAADALNEYFTQNRAFAEGVTTAGIGAGNFVFPVIIQSMISKYDWHGSLLIMAGVMAHCVVIFQIMIPLSYLKSFYYLSRWKWDKYERKNETKEDASHNRIDETPGSIEMVHKYQPDAGKDGLIGKNEPEGETAIILRPAGLAKIWMRKSLNIYKRPLFLLLLASDFLCWLCVLIPFVHLAERSRLQGIDKNTSAWISSLLGITAIPGRLVICSIPSLFKVSVVNLYGITNILVGVFSILSPLFATKVGLFTYAGLYGFLNVHAALGRACIAFLLGNDSFSLAFSWMLLFEGIGIYLGPARAGSIYDATQSYDYSFYFMGTGMITSGALLLLWKGVVRFEKVLERRSAPTSK